MAKSTIIVFVIVQLLRVQCLDEGDYCLAEEQEGTCTPLSLCPALVAEIKNAGKPMPFYIKNKLQTLNCGFKGWDPMVCCANTPNVPNRDGQPVTDDSNHVVPDEFTRRTPTDGPVIVQRHPNLWLLPTDCGNIEADKIFGGQRTNLFEMPWMVLLSYRKGNSIRLSCGGTLINERYVLTAAHCVSYLGNTLKLESAILGEYDVGTDPDCVILEGEKVCAPSVRHSAIEEVIPNTGYTPQSLVDDIALIRLAEPADFNLDSMKPICLPWTSALQKQSLSGQTSVVAGWGATEDGLQSPVLLSVDLPIVDTDDCNAMYKWQRNTTEKQICAGGDKDKDSCGGDSGGPLMYPGLVGNEGVRYVQRGIVSYGPKQCGIGGYPGVYTNVAYYMDWILDNIRS